MPALQFIPIPSPLRLEAFDLAAECLACIAAAGERLLPGDVLIVSSKFAAIATGRVASLDEVQPSERAQALAQQYHMNAALAELVLQESDHVFGGIPGFLLTVKDNLIAPNAGIDTSNITRGMAVLYPAEPFVLAEQLRVALAAAAGGEVGAVLSDSRLMPGRIGTTGLAIGVAGFVPVVDERGKPDLLGEPLKVSQRAVADNLCAGAELLMGEAAEGIPIVIARHTGIEMTGSRPYSWRDTAIDYHLDLYVAIMGNRGGTGNL